MDEPRDPIAEPPTGPFLNLVKLLLLGVAVYLAGLLVAGAATLVLEPLGIRLPDSD